MIQNADDAGATTVQFYVDCRQHGTSGLVKPELASYQGPALISANDAVFSERDWEGIQSLQQSIKADDPFKVGRFGIGFNSVYHLTGTVATQVTSKVTTSFGDGSGYSLYWTNRLDYRAGLVDWPLYEGLACLKRLFTSKSSPQQAYVFSYSLQ